MGGENEKYRKATESGVRNYGYLISIKQKTNSTHPFVLIRTSAFSPIVIHSLLTPSLSRSSKTPSRHTLSAVLGGLHRGRWLPSVHVLLSPSRCCTASCSPPQTTATSSARRRREGECRRVSSNRIFQLIVPRPHHHFLSLAHMLLELLRECFGCRIL